MSVFFLAPNPQQMNHMYVNVMQPAMQPAVQYQPVPAPSMMTAPSIHNMMMFGAAACPATPMSVPAIPAITTVPMTMPTVSGIKAAPMVVAVVPPGETPSADPPLLATASVDPPLLATSDGFPVPPCLPQEPPCSHNSWEDLRTRRGRRILRCSQCKAKWRCYVTSQVYKVCTDYEQGDCSRGESCQRIHIVASHRKMEDGRWRVGKDNEKKKMEPGDVQKPEQQI